jgi:hypothetical protein
MRASVKAIILIVNDTQHISSQVAPLFRSALQRRTLRTEFMEASRVKLFHSVAKVLSVNIVVTLSHDGAIYSSLNVNLYYFC